MLLSFSTVLVSCFFATLSTHDGLPWDGRRPAYATGTVRHSQAGDTHIAARREGQGGRAEQLSHSRYSMVTGLVTLAAALEMNYSYNVQIIILNYG